ncbi:hypothetical protein [Rubritalea sp.]|uniref:hypothetical protein n=1 Tax=Rubritalea sp. TaxID=2109375 RepID=UPI003EFB0D7F
MIPTLAETMGSNEVLCLQIVGGVGVVMLAMWFIVAIRANEKRVTWKKMLGVFSHSKVEGRDLGAHGLPSTYRCRDTAIFRSCVTLLQ